MKQRWIERTFRFDLPEEHFPLVIERLRGAPARLEEKLGSRSKASLTARAEGEATWSIQEHAGHLIDLDQLHSGRLDDFEAGRETLRPADMENRRTREAEHNRTDPREIAAAFRRECERLVLRLDAWDERALARTALHPRLGKPMRIVDLALFCAEHDDHHLTRMTEIARRLAGDGS